MSFILSGFLGVESKSEQSEVLREEGGSISDFNGLKCKGI